MSLSGRSPCPTLLCRQTDLSRDQVAQVQTVSTASHPLCQLMPFIIPSSLLYPLTVLYLIPDRSPAELVSNVVEITFQEID